MSWFTQLTGITEDSPEQVRSQLVVDGDCLVCPDGKRIAFGRLETPTLAELRQHVATANPKLGRLRLREVVGDVQKMHADADNANAMFQVASQFNLLEMTGPSVTPERGVGIYEHDRTQGPACAVSCGAGTIYRNYFAPVGGAIGQSADRQIDCSANLGSLLGNDNGKLWSMQNGYLFPTDQGLAEITNRLQSMDESQRDQYRASLRIGLQLNAAVTLPGARHRVSQAYCSALPVAYGDQATDKWSEFARLILEAAYEATFCAALINSTDQLFLTLLGGGVFRNRDEWITAAIEKSLIKYRDYDLNVAIVSYGASKLCTATLIARWQAKN